ncbi:hypothetical protein Bca52824_059718 [Brassica carinata]|uniref:Uncharacterized protein n=1 Tax=Brassica carinata TaxID=52824 RepID=A0A8X7QUX2_BRACI|nr:hypothetical protein Bca52824_059718 [Brassica carinata]
MADLRIQSLAACPRGEWAILSLINDNGTIQLQPAFFILTLSDLTSLLEAKVRCLWLKLRLLGGMQKPLMGTITEGDDGIEDMLLWFRASSRILPNSKDPYRRYIACPNADDKDCHVWKWWDVAVEEELREFQRELNGVKGEANQREQKLLRLEKQVSEFTKKKSGAKLMVFSLVLGLVLLIVLGILGKDSKDWGVRALFF